MSRTSILIAQNSLLENTGMNVEFKGAAGVALEPTPFYTQNIQQISIATGYPQAKLIGAQAGAVTGSEVNQQEYYKAISRDQESYCEEPIRWILDCLSNSGQIGLIQTATDKQTDKHVSLLKRTIKRLVHHDYRHKTVSNYVISWNSAFELSDLDEAQVEVQHTQACTNKLGYMSKDEVRAEEGLDPLPDGAGEWKDQSDFGLGGEQFLVQSKSKMKGLNPNANNPNNKNEKPTDNTGSASNSNSKSS